MSERFPTPSETVVLQFLWEHEGSTVPEIHRHVCEFGAVQYTTVLKRIQRMEEKGYVKRVTGRGRANAYKAVFKPQSTRKKLVNRLISMAFDNSPQALIQHAIGEHNLSSEDISDIRKLLDRIDEENPEVES